MQFRIYILSIKVVKPDMQVRALYFECGGRIRALSFLDMRYFFFLLLVIVQQISNLL